MPRRPWSMTSVTVHYWAAAREAAGCVSEVLTGETLGDVIAQAGAKHGPELTRLLGICSFIVGDRPVKREAAAGLALQERRRSKSCRRSPEEVGRCGARSHLGVTGFAGERRVSGVARTAPRPTGAAMAVGMGRRSAVVVGRCLIAGNAAGRPALGCRGHRRAGRLHRRLARRLRGDPRRRRPRPDRRRRHRCRAAAHPQRHGRLDRRRHRAERHRASFSTSSSGAIRAG